MINLLCLLISFTSLRTSHGAAVLFIGDTLRPGEALNSSSFMVSASGEFKLGFNSGYLTLRYNGFAVWVANMDSSPISDTSSALLTLDKYKTLLHIITHTGEEGDIVLYSSPFSSTGVVATLMDSGNLVLQEVVQNVSNSPKQMTVLWQSFDEPNYVALLPNMKLNVTYSCKDTLNSLEFGSFALRWDSDTVQLQIWKGKAVLWSSGRRFSTGRFEFFNIPDESKVKYNFSVVSDNEYSFSYTAVGDRDVRSVWVLHTDGELYDAYNNISIARAGGCDGLNTNGGCQRWGPNVSSHCGYLYPLSNDSVMIKHGSFKPISVDPSSDSNPLTPLYPGDGLYSDCISTCWFNCVCLGFEFPIFDNQTGCRYWSINYSDFLEDPASSTTVFTEVLPLTMVSGHHRHVNGACVQLLTDHL